MVFSFFYTNWITCFLLDIFLRIEFYKGSTSDNVTSLCLKNSCSFAFDDLITVIVVHSVRKRWPIVDVKNYKNMTTDIDALPFSSWRSFTNRGNKAMTKQSQPRITACRGRTNHNPVANATLLILNRKDIIFYLGCVVWFNKNKHPNLTQPYLT